MLDMSWPRSVKASMSLNKQWPLVVVCCSLSLFSPDSFPHQSKGTQKDSREFTFKSNASVVLVPVRVNDRQGNAVGGLKKEDFQVFDNNKRQNISGFMVATGAPPKTAANPQVPGGSYSAVGPRHFVIFLFDDMHLLSADLARTQQAATKILSTSLDSGDMAAVASISGSVNSGLTTDPSKLRDAIMKLRPQSLYRSTGTDCPNLDYYQAELIVNEHSIGALQAATEEAFNCNPGLTMRAVAEALARSAAARAFAIGEQDNQVSLASLREIVRRVAALPGLSTLILVSPGFLTLTAQARNEESRIIDTAALSSITINALDARGLYTTELDASDRGTGSAQATQAKSESRRSTMSFSENIMAELANGTGGTYFHNSNDLEGGLRRLSSTPEYLYLLEFYPHDSKQNGSYHRLKVKLSRAGLKVQARRGYFIPKMTKASKGVVHSSTVPPSNH
jgi:VWFA-related protein